MKGLGRRVPTDWDHYDRYPLTAATTPATPVPVVIGVNWYEDFDNPQPVSGRWWIGRSTNLGHVRGGHCVCIEPGDQLDANGNIVRRLPDAHRRPGLDDPGQEGAG